MKIDPLDSDNVNSAEVIAYYRNIFTKYAVEEPKLLDNAIDGIQKFLLQETPHWVVGKEPKYNSLNQIIQHGTPQKILYQFNPENKEKFDKHIRIIDRMMAVVPTVAINLRKQLKDYRESGIPMAVPFSVPTPPQIATQSGESIFSKLNFFKKKETQRDASDYEMERTIHFVNEIPMRLEIFKEWFYGGIAYQENRGTWSDIYSRTGMEMLLARLREFFDYFITSRFLMIYQYGVNIKLDQMGVNTNLFVQAQIRQQKEHEMLQPQQY